MFKEWTRILDLKYPHSEAEDEQFEWRLFFWSCALPHALPEYRPHEAFARAALVAPELAQRASAFDLRVHPQEEWPGR